MKNMGWLLAIAVGILVLSGAKKKQDTENPDKGGNTDFDTDTNNDDQGIPGGAGNEYKNDTGTPGGGGGNAITPGGTIPGSTVITSDAVTVATTPGAALVPASNIKPTSQTKVGTGAGAGTFSMGEVLRWIK